MQSVRKEYKRVAQDPTNLFGEAKIVKEKILFGYPFSPTLVGIANGMFARSPLWDILFVTELYARSFTMDVSMVWLLLGAAQSKEVVLLCPPISLTHYEQLLKAYKQIMRQSPAPCLCMYLTEF